MATTTTTNHTCWLRPGARLALAGVLAGALAAQGQPAAGTPAPQRIEAARTALEKWVETRRAIAKTARDWESDRERLQENIALVQRDITTLRGKIAETQASTSDADKKKAELAEKCQHLEVAGQAFAGAIDQLEARTRALLQRLPDPIREKVRPVSQRIPASAEEAAKLDASKLSQRYLNVVYVLNDIDKWNREVTVTSEVRSLGNGSSAEVTALYIGIGQGYYVSANGEAAGVGTAGPDGWVWTPRNDAAAQITRAIAIAKNELPAEFVLLPLQIQ